MKYIDTDKLKERVTRLIASARQNDWPIAEDYLRRVIDTIDSLQQEQTPTEHEIAEAHRYAEMIRKRDKARIQQEQQDKKEVKFVFPKFLYARTTNNKTIDVSYAPQSLDAVEYIRSDSLQQEQPDEPVTDCYDLKNVSEDLEEAARDFVGFDMDRDELYKYEIGIAAFKAGAEWMKTKMMEGAVEGVVWGNVGKNINISVLKGVCKYLEQDELTYKIRIIILPKEDE